MKNFVSSLLLVFITGTADAQLQATKQCPVIQVNILEGNVNGLEPNFPGAEIKKALPCFTSDEPESDSAKCGGLLSYKDRDLYFYTGRDYIEIREKFNGKLSLPIMGAARGSLFNLLGYPQIKDVSWDAYQTQYGILVLHYNKSNRVNLIQFSKKNAQTLQLCE